jgi:ATP-binding cassette subfamily B (MDR/TAP) protein 1
MIDRVISAIATAKAFNAAAYENSRATFWFNNLKSAAVKSNLVWGFTSGMAQFIMMTMFVQGFWFEETVADEVRDLRTT